MKSEGDAAASAAAAAPTGPRETGAASAKTQGASPAAGDAPVADAAQEPQQPAGKSSDKEAEKKAEKAPGKAKKVAAKRKTTPKRAAASPKRAKRAPASPAAAIDGEATESEPEKQQPKKRAKVTSAKATKKSPVRRKKAAARKSSKQVESESESEDEEQKQVEQSVAALSDDVKAKFGEVVWAKMNGFPFWPCLIMDPRLLPKNLQQTAMKTLDTKYIVYFYVSQNYAPIAYKWIEPWTDTKFKYREGHPAKAAAAPKRRATLMEAIELADKEINLPIQERAGGLLKPEEKEPKTPKSAPETSGPTKRKTGRSAGSTKGKTAAAKKTPKKKQGKEETEDTAKETGTEDEATTEAAAADTAEEEEAGPALSKEEIKAKLASRKTPSKKKQAEDSAAATASAKKTGRSTGKHNGKANGTSAGDLDSKRKKEIELVVPHKSVKSEDIREMTEEAAKKKLGGVKRKSKKDKGDYRVGDLGAFAKKLTRLHATASTRNNDELVKMLRELFEEQVMFRSDVERSGLAAIIAALRKSSSPTVGQTASALRKHMMKILNNDTAIVDGSKKQKAGTDVAVGKASKKRKVESTKAGEATPSTDVATASASSVKTETSVKKDAVNSGVKVEKAQQAESGETAKAQVDKTEADDTKTTETETLKGAGKEKAEVKESASASPKTQCEDDVFGEEKDLDKNRVVFVDMLSNILRPSGAAYAKLAKEIEGLVFDRYSKESNGDYQTQARVIMFGLKKNAELRERLFSGSLHCLELAYAGDDFFRTSE